MMIRPIENTYQKIFFGEDRWRMWWDQGEVEEAQEQSGNVDE